MAYLVRKLNKIDSIDKIGQAENLEDIYADAPTTEFRTTNGSLSTWIIDSLELLDEAVLAMIVSSTKITKMDFAVINTEYLDENNLKYKQTYAGQDIAVSDLQDTHYDILDITINKLINCVKVYKKVYEADNDEGKYIVTYVEGQIRDLLQKAYENKRINMERLNKGIKKGIQMET